VWGSVESLMVGAQKIVSANLFPSAVELLSPAFAAEADFAERNEALLLVRFAGSRQAVEKQSLEAEDLLKTCGRWGGPMPKEDFKLWHVMSRLPMTFEDRCIWSATVPPSHLSRFLRSVEQAGGNSSGASRMWQTSVADGRIRAIEQTNSDCDQVAQLLRRLRAEAEALRGSLVVENAHPEIKNRIDAWGDLGTRARLMQRIKQQVDPQNILAPGRFGF
jgi:glycolate oxidase FAD binding subunit